MYLCKSKISDKGYYIPEINMSIHSIDELVQCCLKYSTRIEETLMTEELLLWIEEDCACGNLAWRLRECCKKKEGLASFLEVLFYYVGYLSVRQIKETIAYIVEIANSNPYEKRKEEIGALVEKKQFGRAYVEYEILLKNLPIGEHALRAICLFNMGVIQAKMQHFVSAYDCFFKSYHIEPSADCLQSLLLCARFAMPKEEYVAFVAEMEGAFEVSIEIEEKVRKISQSFEKSEKAEEILRLIEWEQYGNDEGFSIATRRVLTKIMDKYRTYYH